MQDVEEKQVTSWKIKASAERGTFYICMIKKHFKNLHRIINEAMARMGIRRYAYEHKLFTFRFDFANIDNN